jgi:hypothetical protein
VTIHHAAICAALLTASLAAQSPYPTWRIAHAPDEVRPAIANADLIILTMQNEVLRELNTALTRGNAPTSLAFCHVDVEGVIRRIGAEGVSAGRTSDRLRNPGNAPRPWAAPLVAAHAGRPAKSIDGYAVDLGEKVGVLRPIVEQPMCGGCHGTPDRLAPGIPLVLKQRYPADRATGFRDGEIRGWFWVEMPKRTSGSR